MQITEFMIVIDVTETPKHEVSHPFSLPSSSMHSSLLIFPIIQNGGKNVLFGTMHSIITILSSLSSCESAFINVDCKEMFSWSRLKLVFINMYLDVVQSTRIWVSSCMPHHSWKCSPFLSTHYFLPISPHEFLYIMLVLLLGLISYKSSAWNQIWCKLKCVMALSFLANTVLLQISNISVSCNLYVLLFQYDS